MNALTTFKWSQRPQLDATETHNWSSKEELVWHRSTVLSHF